ncbi:MAG: UPF0262 family protein [Alphaproteobacteria bacterium]|jgi:uncharacterized protein (UPF0262 family)
MSDDDQRISRIEIDSPGVVRFQPDVEREIEVAVFDLVQDNRFRPEPEHFGGNPSGPYALTLAIAENRLNFRITAEGGADVGTLPVPVGSFRKIIKDYFMVCESYYQAIRTATPSQIEAIDMGRRGLHDEGSERLRNQLAGRIDIDHATARRLFTLICALHIRG